MTETVEQARREVIHPEIHRRIIEDMAHFCEVANVPPQFVRHSMKAYCHEAEVEWVRAFNTLRKDGVAGLAIFAGNAETRCMAITGTLVRNFVDARLMTLSSVIDDPDTARKPTVLVIPNFFITGLGKQLTAWQTQLIYDVLLSRFAASKPTVVCIEDLKAMSAAYGPVFAEHISEHFHPA